MNKYSLKSIGMFLLLSLSAISCSASIDNGQTYRDVIREDYFNLYKDSLRQSGINSPSDIIFERVYINVNNAVTFDLPFKTKRGNNHTCDYVHVTYDDVTITFLDANYVPLVWHNHKMYPFNIFINVFDGKDVYSKEDFLKIKDMHENNKNDFSAIDRPYVEPE